MKLKNPEELLEAMDTLLNSWGSETPSEAIWGLNEIVDWLEKEYNVTIEKRFDEPFDEGAICSDEVIAEIKNKLADPK